MMLDNFLRKNRRFLLGALLISALFCIAYRAELYLSFRTIYHGLPQLEFGRYLPGSLPHDLLSIALVLVFLFPLTLLSIHRPRLRSLWFFLIMEGAAILLFIGLGYFHIFEKPLSLSMLGSGLDTFWREIVNSALYEITPRLYGTLGLFSLMVVLFTVFNYYQEKAAARDEVRRLRRWPRILTWTTPLLVFLVLFSATLGDMATLAQRQAGSAGHSLLPTTQQLAKNPIATVLLHPFRNPPRRQTSAATRPAATNASFRYGLNTDSMVTNHVYPRVQLPRGKRYNIVLYFFESTCYPYIGMRTNGRSVTPTWDRLARNSFVAHNHYAHFPLSVNALFSVLASAYEHMSKNWVVMSHPRLPVRTLPEILKTQGYRCAVLHSGDLANFGYRSYLRHRGFDMMLELRHLRNAPYKRTSPLSMDDRAMIKPALDFIRRDPDKPFFITFIPVVPHHPYVVTEDKYKLIPGIEKEKDFKKRSWMRYVNSLYFADACLGELIAALEKAGAMENTLFFLFADHGEAFYQHRQNYLHALFLYEENVHVPFLVYNRQLFSRPIHYRGVSRHIDIMPTILDLLGLQPEAEHEGISLFSAHRQQLALLHTFWNADFLGLRDGQWKYMYQLDNGREELYDVHRDSWEQTNLAAAHPRLLERMRARVLAARNYKEQYFSRVFAKGKRLRLARRKALRLSRPITNRSRHATPPRSGSKQRIHRTLGVKTGSRPLTRPATGGTAAAPDNAVPDR